MTTISIVCGLSIVVPYVFGCKMSVNTLDIYQKFRTPPGSRSPQSETATRNCSSDIQYKGFASAPVRQSIHYYYFIHLWQWSIKFSIYCPCLWPLMSVPLQNRPNNKKIWHNWCHIKCLNLNRTEQNFIHIPKGLKAHEDIIIRYILYSWWKGNDQELIQSNPTSCPKHQMGKEQKRLRRHKVKQHKRKARRAALSQQMATRLTMQNIIENKLIFCSSNIKIRVYGT